jgi:hypothetical protein
VHQRGETWPALRNLSFALVTPALTHLPLPKLEALLEWLVAGAERSALDPDATAATVLQMLDVGRPLVRLGCLTRGLSLYYGLRRAGFPVRLLFGMGRTAGGDGFDGHCWVELAGEPYMEPRDPRPLFRAMYAFGRAGEATETEAAFG